MAPTAFAIYPRPLIGLVGGDRYEWFFLCLCLVLVAATYHVLDRIVRSPFGRALRAVREDDVVAATLGKNILALRVKAFAIGGAVIGLAGALHAYYFTYIDPGEFAASLPSTLSWLSSSAARDPIAACCLAPAR